MKLRLEQTNQFKKDVKRLTKQGADMKVLDDVVGILQNERTLPARYLDHPLRGEYFGFRECHIAPNWLFIYAIDNERLILVEQRTGTHSELFE